MFGQKDDNQNQPFQDVSSAGPAPDNPTPPSDFVNSGFAPPSPPDNGAPAVADDNTPVLADPNPTDFTAPSTPADGPAVVSDTPVSGGAAPTNDDLLSMKQQALQQLTPLVNHLDQSPEEKFRTIMMMIQASDDHTKLNEAFEAAKLITDDKARAQALLDVINEINYFTQHSN